MPPSTSARNFETKGEYINTWAGTDDHGTMDPRGLWVQAGYKLAGLNLDLPLINWASWSWIGR